MRRKLFPALCLSLLAAAPAALGADFRFELGFGWTLVGPSLNARYVNRYRPPFDPPANYIASSAEQRVTFKGRTTYGLNGFLNVLFAENIGLQVLADYHRPGIGGSSAPYTVTAQFQAFQPETRVTEFGALDSSGSLSETTFSLNALARFRVADNLSISASAGPSVFHFEGRAGYIDYTFYDLSYEAGVYTLRGGTYHMVADFGPQTKYGLNAGVEAAYAAARNIILAFDLRWYGAAGSDQQLRLAEDDLITQALDQIEAALGLGTIRVNPSYIRAGLALRFVF
ncbi:MAG TPA: hypothetical protein PLP83_07420 [Candidatus Aminicenantes bacterium]|nr:hypothetical protein [Candidatus Aminicenantes bacterium]